MPRRDVRAAMVGFGWLFGLLLPPVPSRAQSTGAAPPPWPSSQSGSVAPSDPIAWLARMSPAELDRLYQQAGPGAIPAGPVRGRVLLKPGSAMATALSKGGRVVWQGKIFQPEDSTAINRFFGVRAIRGNVSYGESWLDGRPSIILDYSATSLVYAKNRDEIREIAPGLYLGLMYARKQPQPKLKLYFALQVP